jgi:cyclic pyranopterin phosphate synthase
MSLRAKFQATARVRPLPISQVHRSLMTKVIRIWEARNPILGIGESMPVAVRRMRPTGTLRDARGRFLRDLRISVTDRCNFRCVYCMPKNVFGSDHVFLSHDDLLTFEEIARIVGLFKAHGVRKVRLTGGEPLLRRHLERLVEMLARIGGLELTLTTNGALLAKKARDLKMAGLDRVTVSLDAVEDDVFRSMNDVDFPVAKVLAGIDAAAAAGLGPVKINMVVKRGVNEHQILPMARRFKGSGHIVRFIEYMDVGHSNGWRLDEVLPSSAVIAMIDRELPLVPIDRSYPGEVAERWRYADATPSDGAEIGVISSVTQAFCRDCTRARLSTDGKLYTCLFATHGHDLRALVRGDTGDEHISDVLASIWQHRNDRYSEIRSANSVALPKIEMSYIGG